QPDTLILLTPKTFAGLTLAQYDIRLRAVDHARIPAFSGSTLRGAFGFALKQAVCVMSHRNCEKCLVSSRCIYPYVFETPAPAGSKMTSQQNVPHPFTLNVGRTVSLTRGAQSAPLGTEYELLAPGDELSFGLPLAGRAIEFLPYIVFAIHGMAESGLGTGR